MTKKNQGPQLMPCIENGQQVWTVVKGGQVKYAWPKGGLDSLTIAKQIQANWK